MSAPELEFHPLHQGLSAVAPAESGAGLNEAVTEEIECMDLQLLPRAVLQRIGSAVC